MKPSSYNMILGPLQNGDYILFNMLTMSVFEIDDEARAHLEKNDFSAINPETVAALEKAGVILQDMDDEKRRFKVLYETAKYGRGPLSLVIVPTYKCNMACSYCYLGRGEVLTKTMSEDILASIIAFIKNRLKFTDEKGLIVNFYGGEPLLEPEKIFEFLETMKPYVINNLISTNGTTLTDEIVAKLKEYPTAVQVTLAGPASIHDQKRPYKKGNGTYADILKGIQRLVKAKIYTNVRIDVDAENYEQMDRLLKDLENRGIKEGIVLSFERIAQVYHARDYASCLPTSKSVADLWKMAYDRGFRMHVSGPVSCYAFCFQQTARAFTVDPFGDLYPCTGFLGDKKHNIGRISASGRLNGLTEEYYDWLSRDPLSMEKCSSCKALPLCCGGVCSKSVSER